MAFSTPFAIGYAYHASRKAEDSALGAAGLTVALLTALPLGLFALMAVVRLLMILV